MSDRASQLRVRPLEDSERPWLAERIAASWGAREVVSRGRLRDASQLPGVVCVDGEERVGAASYEMRDGDCELVVIEAFRRGAGVGTMLLDAVAGAARAAGCARLWLITTNDNLPALRFYQRRGLRLVAVHAGAIEASRELKPQIPLVGLHGIPIRDEIELELPLR